ncbi:MAG: DUF1722 domain-containing protein [Deltaproteobacteria bacterium]|nr:DUF1722 domain-containing protein [Deltaproteobacteria bacterium]
MPAPSRTAPRWRSPARPIRVGVSSCLLGREVRYDGGHKRNAFVEGELGRFVEWVPVCPEVEIGMGVPRPPIRILQPEATDGEHAQRLCEVEGGRDHTAVMRHFAVRRTRELARERICGFVLKQDSPTCGMERVEVWRSDGASDRSGRGFFARALIEASPLLPVEEEQRLDDPVLRENFVECIFAYHRLQTLLADRLGRGDLAAFHTAHEMQLLAHSRRHGHELGRLVAEARGRSNAALGAAYSEGFMQTLRHPATPRGHGHVLRHMFGRFRTRLDDASRRELRDAIEAYCAGRVPLLAPVTLIGQHVRRLGVDELAGQVYLDPHPTELMLRNRV